MAFQNQTMSEMQPFFPLFAHAFATDPSSPLLPSVMLHATSLYIKGAGWVA